MAGSSGEEPEAGQRRGLEKPSFYSINIHDIKEKKLCLDITYQYFDASSGLWCRGLMTVLTLVTHCLSSCPQGNTTDV